jgi:hypothetical protein
MRNGNFVHVDDNRRYKTAKVPRTMPRRPTASIAAKGPSMAARIPSAALSVGTPVTVCNTTEVPSALVTERDGRLNVVSTPGVEAPPLAVWVTVTSEGVLEEVVPLVVVPVLVELEVVGFVVPLEVEVDPLVVLLVLPALEVVLELSA